jgi:hypothetical protein
MKVVLETLMIGFAIAVLSILLSTFVIPTKACAAEIQVDQLNNWGPQISVPVGCRDCGEQMEVEIPLNPINFFSE